MSSKMSFFAARFLAGFKSAALPMPVIVVGKGSDEDAAVSNNRSALPVKAALDRIPRGDTVAGVNRAIIESLLLLPGNERPRNILDVPCGKGEFLNAIGEFVPNVQTYGIDVAEPEAGFAHNFARLDLRRSLDLELAAAFDLVTCISGVCEFDNSLSFFEQVRKVLRPGGKLIVTNDNLLTVRDRLLYLTGGRFRQYKFSAAPDSSTWKVLTLPNLIRILHDAGFRVEQLDYIKPKISEWIWFPLSMFFYSLQKIFSDSRIETIDGNTTIDLMPHRSLLSRHYILRCAVRDPSV